MAIRQNDLHLVNLGYTKLRENKRELYEKMVEGMVRSGFVEKQARRMIDQVIEEAVTNR